MAKIGLIYVQEGQTHQHEILKNESKTKDYSDFVKSLGWTVSPMPWPVLPTLLTTTG